MTRTKALTAAAFILPAMGAITALTLVLAVTGLAVAANESGCGQGTAELSGSSSEKELTSLGGQKSIKLQTPQRANASTIVSMAVALPLPVYDRQLAARIAIAAALQESRLRNLSFGDRDSLGLFQQRSGWGSIQQRTDPATAARMFFTGGRDGQPGLLDITGWQHMTITQAAQAVQGSAFPDAYAAWQDQATSIVAAARPVAGTTSQTTQISERVSCSAGDAVTGASIRLPGNYTVPAGTPAPIRTAIAWALQQLGSPYRYGGSCTDPHGHDPDGHCDCSSLMQQAYAHAGITIPRSTIGQRVAGAGVSISQVRPGDLIFIIGDGTGPSDPRHVGMAIGSGLLVQAPKTGDVIKVSSISGDWAHPSAVRRIT